MQIGLWRAKEVTLAVYREVQRTRVFNMAAGLSYYFLLSLFPLLIVLATLLGYLPIPNLFNQSMDFAARFVPGEAMGLVRKILQSVLTPNRGGLLSIGLIGTLWAASGGFSAMIDALDIAYDAHPRDPAAPMPLGDSPPAEPARCHGSVARHELPSERTAAARLALAPPGRVSAGH